MMRFCIIILFLLLLPDVQASSKEVNSGVLDLRNTDMLTSGVIRADGEWNFYWKQFIDPVTGKGRKSELLAVPSAWSKAKTVNPDISHFGFASYQLTVLLPEGVHELSLRASEVYSGSSFYINGDNIGFMGFPGANRYQTVLNSRTKIMTFPVKDTVLNLVIHISNFDNREGGIRSSIEFALPEIMQARKEKHAIRDYLLIGAFLIIGIYFLIMQFMIRKAHELYFSLICLLMAFRMLLVSDVGIYPFANIDGVSWMRLQYLSLYLSVPLFTLMVRNLFPIEFPKFFLRLILWLSLPFIAIVIIGPVSLYTLTFIPFVIYLIFTIVINLYTLIMSSVRGRLYSPVISVGLLLIFAGIMNDMLNVADVFETGIVTQYSLFVFLLIYAVIFTDRMYKNMVRSEQLAAEVKTVNENLEVMVDNRTSELREKGRQIGMQKAQLEKRNAELRQAVSTRNRIFTIIGHDIRGPIGYSQQVIEMLLRNKDMSDSEKEEMLQLLSNSSAATYNLLENLLFWGRSEMGSLESIATNFRVAQMVKEVVSVMELGMKEKKQKLVVDIPNVLTAYADPNQVQVVLRNLINNSIKFTEVNGEINITAGWDETYKMIVIRIVDNGIGIPSVVRDKLFDPDEIITTKGTENEHGTGLGLKLSRELMELNKGFLSLEKTSFKGSSFIIGLPVESSESDE